MNYEKERLFKCLYYADMPDDNKQFIQDLIDNQVKEIEQLTKECIGMKDEIKDLCNKLSKLNNIIDELEKDIIKIYNQSYYANDNQIIEIYNRLKELKGETNE